MKNILFIHQSAELYGSDKTLLILVSNLDKTKYRSVVALPNDGELRIALELENIQVVILPVLKLYRKMFVPKNTWSFIKDLRKGFQAIDLLNQTYKFDLIYSNTLAVLIGLLYAKKRKIKHLWHVHEIIESPKLFTKAFRFLLQLTSNSTIVYNSVATQKFWNYKQKIALKSTVILNGLDLVKNDLDLNEIQKIRKTIFKSSNDDELIIALVGRISRRKGQMILLKAFYELIKNNTNLKLIFIGSAPPNQDNFLNDLQSEILNHDLEHQIILIPFYDKIFDIWQSIDIAVVSSIEPETFGLVAVEAMLAKKPVVASNLGGLTEIIVNNETGFLVTPNDELALAKAIQKLIENPKLRAKMGNKGYDRAVKHFSVENYVKKIEAVLESLM